MYPRILLPVLLAALPLLLPGESPPVTPIAQPAGVLVDSDYDRLVADLVADQARTWVFNRFLPGNRNFIFCYISSNQLG